MAQKLILPVCLIHEDRSGHLWVGGSKLLRIEDGSATGCGWRAVVWNAHRWVVPLAVRETYALHRRAGPGEQ